MFGLIVKITAAEGQRDALIAILLDGVEALPGCISYIVSEDNRDPEAIIISETWVDEAHHKASLEIADVRDRIAKARPMMAGFEQIASMTPRGGKGI